MTHKCISKLTITGPDNGLSPGRRHVIIWTNARILLIRTLGTNVSEILIKINTFSLKKMHLKMSSGRRQPSCLGNVLSNVVAWITFIETINMCDYGHTITRMQIPQFHSQVWYKTLYCTQQTCNKDTTRLLHSPSLVAVGLLVAYETWLPIGWCWQLCDWPN